MQNSFLISCVCMLLFTYTVSKSVVNMVVMGLVLGQSLMVISICPVIMQKYLPFITYCEVCCCLHVK